jgi:23S rRNA pseudouridine1911/1915/1917 synthase
VSARYVVGRGEGASLGAFLAARGHDPEAIAAGRVFVGRRRAVDPAHAVAEGQEIVVEAARAAPAGTAVLSEYEGLYAAFKPAGLPTEPDRGGTASLVHAVASLVGVRPDELHAATRLDAPVSGIVVVACGEAGKRRAAALQAEGALGRRYLALTGAAPEPRAGEWDAPVGRGPRGAPTIGGRDARPARTRYALAASATPLASGAAPVLIVAEPVTGRTHQIRLHAAAARAPLLGDARHGGARRVILRDGRAIAVERVALHAGRIEIAGPAGPSWRVTAPLPEDLANLWVVLGGDPGAPERALEMELDAAEA